MTEKVTIEYREDLPMPLIYLPEPDHLAAWYVSQLNWSLEKGKRDITISVFDNTAMGGGADRAAPVVLRAVTDFLYEHPSVERLTILCAGESAYRAYCFHWNMWYAERKSD